MVTCTRVLFSPQGQQNNPIHVDGSASTLPGDGGGEDVHGVKEDMHVVKEDLGDMKEQLLQLQKENEENNSPYARFFDTEQQKKVSVDSTSHHD